MIYASYTRHLLKFHRPAGTSRGVLHEKECWFVVLKEIAGICGIGEVAYIPGLSIEEQADMEIKLDHICKLINRGEMSPAQILPALPGIQFALETALEDLHQGGKRILFPSTFSEGKSGIPINGLIWMGEPAFMLKQIRDKLDQGFRVLKLKVGGLKPEEELEVIRQIRSTYSVADLEIRLDANGAWTPHEAPERMASFLSFGIHSIEQPIHTGQIPELAEICSDPVIPVALDEELLGIRSYEERKQLLELVKPAYVIIKPGLLGGFSVANEWIRLAESTGTGWWITSALESNIGLNAIAQWTASLNVTIPQGLGTGQLYENNIPSPLKIQGDRLWYLQEQEWDVTQILDPEI